MVSGSWERDFFGTCSCLIPGFDGAIHPLEWKEAVLDRYVTGGSRPRTLTEQQYTDRKLPALRVHQRRSPKWSDIFAYIGHALVEQHRLARRLADPLAQHFMQEAPGHRVEHASAIVLAHHEGPLFREKFGQWDRVIGRKAASIP